MDIHTRIVTALTDVKISPGKINVAMTGLSLPIRIVLLPIELLSQFFIISVKSCYRITKRFTLIYLLWKYSILIGIYILKTKTAKKLCERFRRFLTRITTGSEKSCEIEDGVLDEDAIHASSATLAVDVLDSVRRITDRVLKLHRFLAKI